MIISVYLELKTCPCQKHSITWQYEKFLNITKGTHEKFSILSPLNIMQPITLTRWVFKHENEAKIRVNSNISKDRNYEEAVSSYRTHLNKTSSWLLAILSQGNKPYCAACVPMTCSNREDNSCHSLLIVAGRGNFPSLCVCMCVCNLYNTLNKDWHYRYSSYRYFIVFARI